MVDHVGPGRHLHVEQTLRLFGGTGVSEDTACFASPLAWRAASAILDAASPAFARISCEAGGV